VTERHPPDAPLEELLRAALAARAHEVTSASLRALGPPRPVPKRRNRWLRIGAPTSLVLATAAAFGAVSLVGTPDIDLRGEPARRPDVLVATPTPSATPTPGATSAPPVATTAPSSPFASSSGGPSGSTPPTAKRRGVEAIRLSTPNGWVATDVETVGTAVVERCYDAPWSTDRTLKCDLDSINVRASVVGDPSKPRDFARLDTDPYGYAPVPMCAGDGHLTYPDNAQSITPRVTVKNRRTIDGHGADYRVVFVTCRGGQNFQIRTWALTDLGIDIMSIGASPDTDVAVDHMIASIDLSAFTARNGNERR